MGGLVGLDGPNVYYKAIAIKAIKQLDRRDQLHFYNWGSRRRRGHDPVIDRRQKKKSFYDVYVCVDEKWLARLTYPCCPKWRYENGGEGRGEGCEFRAKVVRW